MSTVTLHFEFDPAEVELHVEHPDPVEALKLAQRLHEALHATVVDYVNLQRPVKLSPPRRPITMRGPDE